MAEPARGFFLYVNWVQVPEFFQTMEEAEAAAVPHQQSRAELQIKTTWGMVRTWNYAYDLNRWVEKLG